MKHFKLPGVPETRAADPMHIWVTIGLTITSVVSARYRWLKANHPGVHEVTQDSFSFT